MLVEFVDAHRDRFGIGPVCAVLDFPVSSYYYAKKQSVGDIVGQAEKALSDSVPGYVARWCRATASRS